MTALMLACSLAVSFSTHVFAESSEDGCGEFLGDESNISGYFLPDENEDSKQSRVAIDKITEDFGGVTYYPINSIVVGQTYDLLVCGSEKAFTRSDLPSAAEYILMRGTLYFSIEELRNADNIMFGGVCYYGYNYLSGKNEYISAISTNAVHGRLVEERVPISGYLNSGITYYSYVKNKYGAGYISGSWKLYYSYN